MKKFLTLVCLLLVIPGLAVAQTASEYTTEQAVYGVLGGLNHDAVAEVVATTDPFIIENTLAANGATLELLDTNVDVTGTTTLDLLGPTSTWGATTSLTLTSPITAVVATTSFDVTSPITTITASTSLDTISPITTLTAATSIDLVGPASTWTATTSLGLTSPATTITAATSLGISTATSTYAATTSHSLTTPLFNWSPIADYGGYTLKQYFARGVADGTGGFDIEVDIPAGDIVLLTQMRVDVLLVGPTNWSAAFIDGSVAATATTAALAQNTKVNTWFDANGATAILSAETDIRVTPDAGNITAGNISAYVTTLTPIALANAKVITYSATTWTEAGANDGTTTTSNTLTLVGDTFVAGTDFVAEGLLVPTNVPAGLTVVATRTSSTVLTVTMTGAATAHTNGDDVSDLTFTLGNGAFTSGIAANVVSATVATLIVDFAD
jgi:hypothetical protein